ncbi:MAG: transcriptional regulator [Myxococcaceae bacterium]|nr:transcriptional regulator [Myxococcaceae bacterium]
MTTAQPLILLVEDDRDIRESIKEVLEDEGYSVAEAADGVEAIERLGELPTMPELVLLDLMMPRMNGVQLRAEMAKQPVWDRIPVVVLSADADMHSKVQGLHTAGQLEKPIKLSLLLETVSRAIELGRPAAL